MTEEREQKNIRLLLLNREITVHEFDGAGLAVWGHDQEEFDYRSVFLVATKRKERSFNISHRGRDYMVMLIPDCSTLSVGMRLSSDYSAVSTRVFPIDSYP
jgi:hypothetical protein